MLWSVTAATIGTIVDEYIVALIDPGVLTREMQIAIGVAVVAVNVLIYGLVWTRRRRREAVSRSPRND